eukprot:7633686-Alexandrium_andersonii.AAC.1
MGGPLPSWLTCPFVPPTASARYSIALSRGCVARTAHHDHGGVHCQREGFEPGPSEVPRHRHHCRGLPWLGEDASPACP